MSAPNNNNYPIYGNNFIPINNIGAITTIPMNNVFIQNNIPYQNYITNGANNNALKYEVPYSYQIPIPNRVVRSISPLNNGYNQIIYNNNNPFNYNQPPMIINNNPTFVNSHHRRQRTDLLNNYNIHRNTIIDEELTRERPFYNRPNERLPDKKNFRTNIMPTYNVGSSNYAYNVYLKRKNYEKKMKGLIERTKTDMLKKQNEARNEPDKEYEEYKPQKKTDNDKLNELLDNMCVYGNIEKMQLKAEKQKHPEKFIDTQQALQMEKDDPELFALGLLSSILEENQIETVIEKGDPQNENDDTITTSMQFLTNGLLGKKKYDLSFDMSDEKAEELIFNEKEFEKFKEALKDKLNKEYGIPKEKIIITFPQKGSFDIQVIFQSDEFNDLDLEDFKDKFKNDDKFTQLYTLKEVHSSLIMGGCRLSKNQLDYRGNRTKDWGVGQKRGREQYYPPEGWIGIGIKVFDKYFNDKWLDMQNKPGEDEWVVAYHGVGRGQCVRDVNGIPSSIIGMGFKAGKAQEHKNCEDSYHPGNKVGEGVYCTPYINIAEEYAGKSEINGIEYKTVIMVRVKPSARRQCVSHEESRVNKYWVVNGTPDEIRPYRILYKRVEKDKK